MDFIRQVGSGDHGSTMDQPWIKDGSKWWTKNFKHVDVLCWYRIRTNIMIVIINYESYWGICLCFFSASYLPVIAASPWLVGHIVLHFLYCWFYIISYHHSYQFGWPTLHDINPGSC
jgi:hypothetical protein